MKEILFLSGKGGTGKTSVSASCAFLQGACVTCDYDVEASNMHMLFKLTPVKVESVNAGELARINPDICIGCSLCETLCRFDAIEELVVNNLACEGCRLCFHICPVEAVSLLPRMVGDMCQSAGGFQLGHFHTNLRPGAGNSGKVVTQLKDVARQCALEKGSELLISDGPPGIGCSVIAALTGVNLVVMVTEPGISAFDDLKRLWELVQSRQVMAVAIINKWDLNPGYARAIEEWAAGNGIVVAGRIPFSEEISEALSRAEIPAADPELAGCYQAVWEAVKAAVRNDLKGKEI